ncbi:MAG: hypothetical protein SAL70_37975, partial [Scytonema sp. PMC 1070.18]|nr:hypothetical protein [Scytonema sp. PMC 1070.18]
NKIYLFKYLNNPFMSLFEKVNHLTIDGFKTILCGNHTELSLMGKIQQIKTKPVWLQVVHDKNVSNRIRGIRVPIKNLKNDFIIHPSCIPEKEELFPYILEKGLTLMKYPIDSSIIYLPNGLKVKIKKIWAALKV